MAPLEIHCLTRFVDRPIQIPSLSLHRNARFVHAPRSAHGSGKSVPTLLEFGSVLLDPPRNRRVRHINAAFAHHDHQIAIAQFVAQLPANAQHHDLLVEVPTFEQVLYGYLSIIADAGCALHQSPLTPRRDGSTHPQSSSLECHGLPHLSSPM